MISAVSNIQGLHQWIDFIMLGTKYKQKEKVVMLNSLQSENYKDPDSHTLIYSKYNHSC